MGRKPTSNVPLTFWRLRLLLLLLLQDFATPRLHHWVLVLGLPVYMTDTEGRKCSLDLTGLQFKCVVNCICERGQLDFLWRRKVMCANKVIYLLDIVNSIHRVIYPLPSWRQL